jgi:hypothetical protein
VRFHIRPQEFIDTCLVSLAKTFEPTIEAPANAGLIEVEILSLQTKMYVNFPQLNAAASSFNGHYMKTGEDHD